MQEKAGTGPNTALILVQFTLRVDCLELASRWLLADEAARHRDERASGLEVRLRLRLLEHRVAHLHSRTNAR